MNKVYLTGDLHANWDSRESFIRSLDKSDILIVLGDFGFNWSPLIFKTYLENEPACKMLWIDGNHENFSYLNTFPIVDMYGGKCHKLSDKCYHLMRGEMFEIGGKKYFAFGGARSIDRIYRTPGLSWWPEEVPSRKEYAKAMNKLKIDHKYDYLLTHTGSHKDLLNLYPNQDLFDDETGYMIEDIKALSEYKYHFFGHMHKYANFENTYCLYEEIWDVEKEEFVCKTL